MPRCPPSTPHDSVAVYYVCPPLIVFSSFHRETTLGPAPLNILAFCLYSLVQNGKALVRAITDFLEENLLLRPSQGTPCCAFYWTVPTRRTPTISAVGAAAAWGWRTAESHPHLALPGGKAMPPARKRRPVPGRVPARSCCAMGAGVHVEDASVLRPPWVTFSSWAIHAM